MTEHARRAQEAAAYIRRHWRQTPEAGIVLGTGLGRLSESVASPVHLPFDEIPHFLPTTAEGHWGRVVCGRLGAATVVVMQGRAHAYEGHDLWEITLPVRVVRELGAQLLVVTSACGGLNPHYAVGDILVIDDHINVMFDSPLVEANVDRLGPRSRVSTRLYDAALIATALEVARRENVVTHRGVYAAMKGPNYETRAEYRMLRRMGADGVGMSTVPEVIVAADIELRVLGLSVLTNICRPDATCATQSHEVVSAAEGAAADVLKIVAGVLARLSRQ